MPLRKIRLFTYLVIILTICSAARADDRQIQHIDIGGRKLTLSTKGTGSPAVVIETGYATPGAESAEWERVFNAIAQTNQVCMYDRAGLGSSDPAPGKTRTSHDVAQDLHKLLTAAKIHGPYVLVGHSIGGLHVRVFASMYPKDVAGVALIDSSHPDQDAKWLAVLGPAKPGEDRAIAQARDFLSTRMKTPMTKPEPLDSAASCAQARAARSLGDKPLAVVTHSPKWKMIPDLPDDVLKQVEDVSQQLQNDLATLSTNSTHTIAEHAGHHIHEDEPELVIKAIREVIEKVNRPSAH